MSIFKKINYVFNKKQKVQSVFLCLGIFIGALFELMGVSLIAELVSLISDPSTVHDGGIRQWAYELVGATSDREFFLDTVIFLIIVYLVKNVYLMLISYIQYTFIYNNQLRLSGRLVDCYLRKPYTYHLDTNSAELIRSIMLDSERFFQLLLTSFSVFSEVLISLLLCIYLLVVDPMITISVVVILGVVSGLYLLIFHGKTKENGKISQYNDGKMHQAINQALGAVKDIKILHREEYFVDAFTDCGAKKYRAVRNNEVLGQAPKFLIETVCIGAILLVLVYKLYSGQDLADMIPQLAAFAMAAFKLLPSVGKIDNYLNLMIFLKPSVDLVYNDIKDTEDILHAPALIEQADSNAKITADTSSNSDNEQADSNVAITADNAITIENVSYRYPGTEKDVIKKAEDDVDVKSPNFVDLAVFYDKVQTNALESPIAIHIPWKVRGYAIYRVARWHGEDSQEIPEGEDKQKDGEYFEKGEDEIILHLKNFSDYALGESYLLPGSPRNPWPLGEGVTAVTNGTALVIGGEGAVSTFAKADGLAELLPGLTAITITSSGVTNVAANAFKDVGTDVGRPVALTLPDNWQGELPKDGSWYGATIDMDSFVYPLTVRNVAFLQRYPWNGLVDVSCNLTGSGTVELKVTALTNDVDFIEAKMLSGETVIDLDAASGVTNGVRFVWDAAKDLPAGFKAQNVKVKVTVEK